MELVFLIIFFITFLLAAFTGGKRRSHRSRDASNSFIPFTYEKDEQPDSDSSFSSWSDSSSDGGGGGD
ncbi:MAG TPA: hypothetical protein VNM45_08270 [Bacillus sp. (in: firmicutes)]|nr:hypothetical protein [Bacillus sp. (in: firmicutes)]